MSASTEFGPALIPVSAELRDALRDMATMTGLTYDEIIGLAFVHGWRHISAADIHATIAERRARMAHDLVARRLARRERRA